MQIEQENHEYLRSLWEGRGANMLRHLRVPAKTLWLSSQKREERERTLSEGGNGFKEGFISTDLWRSVHNALCCVWTSRTAFIYIGEWFTTWQWHWTFPENAWNISLSFSPPGSWQRECIVTKALRHKEEESEWERQFELRGIWKHWPWILILWTHRISSWAFNSKWALLNINAVGLGFRHIILNYNPAVCSLLSHCRLSPFLFLLLSFPISIRLGLICSPPGVHSNPFIKTRIEFRRCSKVAILSWEHLHLSCEPQPPNKHAPLSYLSAL